MDIFNQTPIAARSALGRRQQAVINSVVRLACGQGLPIPGESPLETTGRHAGLPPRTAMCDGLEGGTFWLSAQRGATRPGTEHRGRSLRPGQGRHIARRMGSRHRAHPRRRFARAPDGHTARSMVASAMQRPMYDFVMLGAFSGTGAARAAITQVSLLPRGGQGDDDAIVRRLVSDDST
jgi:hypothetical protein